MNGILWVMRTGVAWADMPDRYLPGSTCHRYFQAWVKSGVFIHILNVLAEDLYARGQLELSECFIDGTSVPAKDVGVGKTKRGKGSKIMAIADRAVSPFTYRLLRRMNPSLLSPHLRPILWRMPPNG